MGDVERHQPYEGQPDVEILDPRHFYAAYVFDRAAERESDVKTVIEQASELRYPVHYWWLSNAMDLQGAPDRLIVCVHHPSRSEDAGMDLYNILSQKEINWDDLDAATVEEYHFLGKPINDLGDLRHPEGNLLFPDIQIESVSPDSKVTLLTILSEDVRDEAESRLGRDLTSAEFTFLLAMFRKTLDWMDWTFYLGEAIRLCQESGQVGPAVEDSPWDSLVSDG